MTKYDQLYTEMKEAMKAKDQQKVLFLRGLISNVKNATVNAGKEITDDAVISAVKKTLKELDQSAESFNKAGRTSEVEKIDQDRLYLQEFLPRQASEEEVKSAIDSVLSEFGVSSKKDMGKVMKAVMAKLGGAADGKTVSKLVMQVLV